MGNKTLKNTRENKPSTAENKGIISKEFFASHFCRTLFLSARRLGLQKQRKKLLVNRCV